MTRINTGLQLNLSTMHGAILLKNPDIQCDIDGTAQILKFGKHNLQLTVGEHTLIIKIAPIMGQAIQDQTISFTIQENALTCIDYKVDMFSKSSIKLEGIKEQKQEQAKEWTGAKKAARGLGYALGRLFGKSKSS